MEPIRLCYGRQLSRGCDATVGCAMPLFLVSLTHRVVGGRSSLRKPISVHEQDSLGFALIFRNALSKVSVKDGAS